MGMTKNPTNQSNINTSFPRISSDETDEIKREKVMELLLDLYPTLTSVQIEAPKPSNKEN